MPDAKHHAHAWDVLRGRQDSAVAVKVRMRLFAPIQLLFGNTQGPAKLLGRGALQCIAPRVAKHFAGENDIGMGEV
jgi:hypothetical protein